MNSLYNCCEGEVAPDWGRFERLELSGSKDHDGETEAMVKAAEAEFFTVYGRLPDFSVEPITDVKDPREALAVATELSWLSSLELVLHPTLF